MELTWPIKLRIALVSAVGAAVIGMYYWPKVAPADPFGVVSLVSGTITTNDAMVLLAIAFGIGLVSYFLSWPYGSRIGILAVPAGLAVWAVRGGNMGTLMQLNSSVEKREQLFAIMRWEPLLWLAIVGAGFLGVFAGWGLIRPAKSAEAGKPKNRDKQKNNKLKAGDYLSIIAAIVGSAVVAQFFIGIFARNFALLDPTYGVAVSQPATAQIVFAVLVSFGIAGFLVKRVLDLDYIWPIIGSCFITAIATRAYGKEEVLAYFFDRWPAVFFSSPVLTVLPIQVVVFGTIGSVAGYWLAVSYDYHWHQEVKGE
ncbi:MAG: hypothetical protein ABII09_04475 [Planctomycetota bacterium]